MSYASMIRAYKKGGQWCSALFTFESMVKHDLTVHSAVYSSVIDLLWQTANPWAQARGRDLYLEASRCVCVFSLWDAGATSGSGCPCEQWVMHMTVMLFINVLVLSLFVIITLLLYYFVVFIVSWHVQYVGMCFTAPLFLHGPLITGAVASPPLKYLLGATLSVWRCMPLPLGQPCWPCMAGWCHCMTSYSRSAAHLHLRHTYASTPASYVCTCAPDNWWCLVFLSRVQSWL